MLLKRGLSGNTLKNILIRLGLLEEKVPFKFGIDADGNYGYIKDGADSVTPFKSYKVVGSVPDVYMGTYTFDIAYLLPETYQHLTNGSFLMDYHGTKRSRNSIVGGSSVTFQPHEYSYSSEAGVLTVRSGGAYYDSPSGSDYKYGIGTIDIYVK